MGFTRRDFIMRVGRAGGYSAAFVAMQGLGLMEARATETPTIEAAPGSGKGVKVVILGAGIAGMVAAYELRALGYEPVVLEARSRPGGRNWTVRGGDKVEFLDGTVQTSTWDPGNYQNVGPARLPSIHKTMLAYCRKFGVEMQVEVNMTNSAYMQNDDADGGKPAVMREVINDARGHVSELLAKCINQGALDQDLVKGDRDKMLAFLRIYGSLDQADQYAGTERAGFERMAGAGDDTAILNQPVDMHTLLDEDFWRGMMFSQASDMQATMMQPVGGMDRIAYAFAKQLGAIVRYNAPVTEIRKTATGVKIGYKEKGADKVIEARYCICTMPLTILKTTPNDFSAPYQEVIKNSRYVGAYKVAWESRRFWEQDYNIYGGLEFCNVGCSPIWFPSAGLFSERGVFVSGYTDENNTPFGSLPLQGKFDESRKAIERLHPGHGKELEKPMYVGWSRIPYNEGSWIGSYGPAPRFPGMELTPTTGQAKAPGPRRMQTNSGYETLIEPDGPFVFAGDHVSHIVGWQEGAALSALRAVQQVSDMVKQARLTGPLGKIAIPA
jgi:monoamine oxidase